MSKPRSDAKLKSLPPHQRETLIRWLVDENLSYDQAKERLHLDFNVSTSVGALSNFYATECFALRSSEAKSFAEQVEKELLDSEEKFDRATIALVKQKAFERAYARNGNLKELGALAAIVGSAKKLQLKEREVSISERRVTLLEKKAAQADAAKDVMKNEALTPAEREVKMREIFGLK